MLYDMSTIQPETESLAADSEDYATHALRSYSPTMRLATHGYRDVDSGMPADTTSIDIDSLLDGVDTFE